VEKSTAAGISGTTDPRCGKATMPHRGRRHDTAVMAEPLGLHRALADPTRVALLELLRRGGPRSALELADRLGVHVNTVRGHLTVLEREGLATSGREDRATPGRPRRMWTAAPLPAGEDHALLASGLVSALAPLPDGAELAERAGRAWGGSIVAEVPGDAPPIARVQALLEARGFEPRRHRRGIAMGRCPFRELAEREPGVVCGFHAGLLQGALDELGADVTLAELRPWITKSTCLARLERRPAA
jgi:predicted ArsR family transcriptional regulator